MYPTPYQPVKPTNKKLLLIVGILTLIIVIVIVIVDVVMWSSKKGLFKPYEPLPTPAGSIAPNGNTADPSPGLQTISPVLQSGIQANMGAYKSTKPYTAPNQFGYYK
jgi:hypothetical protein